jgi:hypothetical protein
MNYYFYKILIKQRQQQILKEFRGIQRSRAASKLKVGLFKKGVQGIWAALFTLQIRLQNCCRQ